VILTWRVKNGAGKETERKGKRRVGGGGEKQGREKWGETPKRGRKEKKTDRKK
jgi:hypothetical protein